jgi:hypothetical protein
MIGVSKQVHICLLDRKKGKHEKEVQWGWGLPMHTKQKIERNNKKI